MKATQLTIFVTALALSWAIASHAQAQCGDGTVVAGETCDDGNTLAGDGCNGTCAIEAGFACRAQPRIVLINASFDLPISAVSAGWVLAAGTIDQIGTGCLPSDDGLLAVDMNGTTRGEIYQDVATAIGTTYVMTLRGSANCIDISGQPCSRVCTKLLTISAADAATPTAPHTTTGFVLPGGPMAVGGAWRDVRFEFTATSVMTRLRFSGSDPSAAGPMVDRAAIPESVCGRNTCGNSALDAMEACDDGNQVSGDGCSSDCSIVERGWTCATAGAACVSTCGDGIKVSNEACEDGNMTAGDGCSATCTIEPGWTCIINPLDTRSVCLMICGNGTIDPGEICDASGESATCDTDCTTAMCGDGTRNMSAGETCDASGESATCDVDCTAASCGDTVINSTAGESCDDGNMASGDGCSATCGPDTGWVCSCAMPTITYSAEMLAGRLGGDGGGPGPLMGCLGNDVLIGLAFDWSTGNGTATRTRTICGAVSVSPAGVVTTARTTSEVQGGSGCAGWDPSVFSPDVLCPTGMAIVGLRGTFGGGTLFTSASIVCQGMGVDGRPAGMAMTLPVPGGSGIGTAQVVDCAVGTIARSFQTRRGCGQDSLDLFCGVPTAECNSASICRTVCGDGAVGAPVEACDTGGESATCDADCTPAMCGDGRQNMTAGESCDDGNTTAGDGCSATCVSELCGNSVVDAGEACDAGGESATCDVDCTAAMCGDATLNVMAAETCDAGVESATCDLNCTAVMCGDGTMNVAAGETCDDGNTTAGDGCSATCIIEAPPDAGVRDGGVRDAGPRPDAPATDAGGMDTGPNPGGLAGGACNCAVAAPARVPALGLGVVFALFVLGARRRRRARARVSTRR